MLWLVIHRLLYSALLLGPCVFGYGMLNSFSPSIEDQQNFQDQLEQSGTVEAIEHGRQSRRQVQGMIDGLEGKSAVEKIEAANDAHGRFMTETRHDLETKTWQLSK